MILFSIIGAYMMGSNLDWYREFGEKNERSDAGLKYLMLKKNVGYYDNIEKKYVAGIVKPLLLYRQSPIDPRVHIAFVSSSTVGKTSMTSIYKKICAELGLHFSELQNPTSAKLLGMSVSYREGKKEIKVPICPELVSADVLFLDEGKEVFTTRSKHYEEKNLAIYRKVCDYFPESTLHNDSVSNELVAPFSPRSTLIVSTVIPQEYMRTAVEEGTLQRFLIYAVEPDINYDNMILEYKEMCSPKTIAQNADVYVEKNIHIETLKNVLRARISKRIKEAVDKARKTNTDRPEYWYQHIKIDIDVYNEVLVEERRTILKERKNRGEDGEDEHKKKRSFEQRAEPYILKIALIISVINGKGKVGREELFFAREYVLNNLERVDRVLGLYGEAYVDRMQFLDILKMIEEEIERNGIIDSKMKMYQLIKIRFNVNDNIAVQMYKSVEKYLKISKGARGKTEISGISEDVKKEYSDFFTSE